MNLAATQPVAGNNTLWLNSSNNHLYRDGVDLEGGGGQPTSATFFIPPTEWLVPASQVIEALELDSDGVPIFTINNSNPVPGGVATFNPIPNYVPSSLALSSFSVIYRIISNDLVSNDVELSSIQFTNNATNVKTAVPVTGTMELDASANTYITTITVTTPALLSANEIYNVQVIVTGDSQVSVAFYGVVCNFIAP